MEEHIAGEDMVEGQGEAPDCKGSAEHCEWEGLIE